MLNEDDVKLSGYYDVVSVESSEDADYGHCTLVEIKNDDNEIVQIGFYYNIAPDISSQNFGKLEHVCVEKVSVLKKGHHY